MPIGLCTVFNYIDQQWRSDYRNDLEFGRFTAKSFCVEGVEVDGGAVDAVLRVHNALCEHIDATLPKFCDEVARAKEDKFRDEYGKFGINAAQHMHFQLLHLFRALCIIIVRPVSNATRQNVYFVSTGNTRGLSEPISLEGIGDEWTRLESGGRQVVSTTLPEAIEFVKELENREQRAGLDLPDQTVLDDDLGGVIKINKRARKDGYTGADPYGPSAARITGSNVAPMEFSTSIAMEGITGNRPANIRHV
jgi:hypothetical protein